MKPELEKLCADFTANREEIRKAFGRKAGAMQPVCANIFCANGQTADAGRLKECFRVVKKRTKPFSRFRNGKVRSVLSGMLSLGENPEGRMTLADEYYRLLRRYFKGTEYLELDTETKNQLVETIIRYKKAGYPIMNSVSGLRNMQKLNFSQYCWITNFIFSDGSRSPKCMGYTHNVCDRCGFSMGGEMAAVYHLKPDTILSGLKLRLNSKR